MRVLQGLQRTLVVLRGQRVNHELLVLPLLVFTHGNHLLLAVLIEKLVQFVDLVALTRRKYPSDFPEERLPLLDGDVEPAHFLVDLR